MKSGLQYAGRGLTTPLRGRGSLGENQFQSMTGQRRADASPRRPPAPGCAADSMLRPRLLLALVLLSSGTRVSRRGLALLCSSLHLNHLRILSVCLSVCLPSDPGRGEGGLSVAPEKPPAPLHSVPEVPELLHSSRLCGKSPRGSGGELFLRPDWGSHPACCDRRSTEIRRVSSLLALATVPLWNLR